MAMDGYWLQQEERRVLLRWRIGRNLAGGVFLEDVTERAAYEKGQTSGRREEGRRRKSEKGEGRKRKRNTTHL